MGIEDGVTAGLIASYKDIENNRFLDVCMGVTCFEWMLTGLYMYPNR